MLKGSESYHPSTTTAPVEVIIRENLITKAHELAVNEDINRTNLQSGKDPTAARKALELSVFRDLLPPPSEESQV
ncbi:hypothetical protein KKG52_01875 [Patescibacteria group bacterium]|nr:hypothetical protein [Patescibacteria group bacterium]